MQVCADGFLYPLMSVEAISGASHRRCCREKVGEEIQAYRLPQLAPQETGELQFSTFLRYAAQYHLLNIAHA